MLSTQSATAEPGIQLSCFLRRQLHRPGHFLDEAREQLRHAVTSFLYQMGELGMQLCIQPECHRALTCISLYGGHISYLSLCRKPYHTRPRVAMQIPHADTFHSGVITPNQNSPVFIPETDIFIAFRGSLTPGVQKIVFTWCHFCYNLPHYSHFLILCTLFPTVNAARQNTASRPREAFLRPGNQTRERKDTKTLSRHFSAPNFTCTYTPHIKHRNPFCLQRLYIFRTAFPYSKHTKSPIFIPFLSKHPISARIRTENSTLSTKSPLHLCGAAVLSPSERPISGYFSTQNAAS